jgi:uncharacterized protein YndB with AHSA1/START domain
MAKTVITPDKDSVISEIEIAAPTERVFQALIDRRQAMQWGTNDGFEVMLWEMEARPGGKWRSLSKARKGPATGHDFNHHGEIQEIDPPRLLAYSWFANWHDKPLHPTLVRWELTPSKTGTSLKLTHSGLAQIAGACEGYSQGWPGLLQAIKIFVEK